jgi:hypothetical protein
MKKVMYPDGTSEVVNDEFALRLYEQGIIKGFAPAGESKEEAKAEAEETPAKEAQKKKGK